MGRLGLLASETLSRIAKITPSSKTMSQTDWKPEFAQFQLEGTPGQPCASPSPTVFM
jgi:hypothetical protein